MKERTIEIIMNVLYCIMWAGIIFVSANHISYTTDLPVAEKLFQLTLAIGLMLKGADIIFRTIFPK